METLPQITKTGQTVARLFNLETDEDIVFDSISPGKESTLGYNLVFNSSITTGNTFVSYQGLKESVTQFTGYIDRYWLAQDVRPIITLLKSWQKLTKNKVPPLLAYEHGGYLLSPCLFSGDIRIKEGRFINGVPTQLEIQYALVEVDLKNIVK